MSRDETMTISKPVLPARRRFLQVLAGTAGALIVGVRLAEAGDAPVPVSGSRAPISTLPSASMRT